MFQPVNTVSVVRTLGLVIPEQQMLGFASYTAWIPKSLPKACTTNSRRLTRNMRLGFCSRKNVYVAPQFTGKPRNGTGPDADASDTLSAITMHRWLDSCA